MDSESQTNQATDAEETASELRMGSSASPVKCTARDVLNLCEASGDQKLCHASPFRVVLAYLHMAACAAGIMHALVVHSNDHVSRSCCLYLHEGGSAEALPWLNMEELSDASCCEEREAWEEWDTQSSLSLHHENVSERRVAAEAGARRGGGGVPQPPRSTAYYYGDLERLKRPLSDTELSEAKPEPAFRQRSLTEHARHTRVHASEDYGERVYSKPDDGYVTERKAETYSTAGTFPLPQRKEKEPLLAELEGVGGVPLVQLAEGGVRRSRSWYLCCPNTGQEEEASRESSWRYSSLRPVTAPPAHNQHTFSFNMCEMSETATCAMNGGGVAQESREVARLRRALAAERARAAAEARAHDARLAELHGVIAELVRRRDTRDRARAIPEEESEHSVSDACESTTQPAGELEQDGERSRTDMNDSSSLLSPAELPAPRAPPDEGCVRGAEVREAGGGGRSGTDTSDYIGRSESLPTSASMDNTDHIDALDSGQGVDMESRRAERRGRARRSGGGEGESCRHHCSHSTRRHSSDGDHSDRLHEEGCECEAGGECCRSRVLSCAEFVRQSECYLHAPAQGRGSEARVAARVRLRRMEEPEHGADCVRSAHGDPLTASADEDELPAPVSAARVKRLSADVRVLEGALADAKDTAERLWLTCALHESWSVCLCGALRAADRALETYDVLLALAESQHNRAERGAAELVARRLLGRLEAEAAGANIAVGDSLLSPGPWLQSTQSTESGAEWTTECEERLRQHAARLKSETAAIRTERPPQPLHSHSLLTAEGGAECGDESVRQQDMECAVLAQEAAAAREERAAALAGLAVERARAAGLARALAALTAPAPLPHQPVNTRHHLTQGACEPARVHSSGRTRRALAAETNL